LPVRPTVHKAVLPAGVPERATDFLGLKGAWGTSVVLAMINRFSVG
jgi:hypothetical protein